MTLLMGKYDDNSSVVNNLLLLVGDEYKRLSSQKVDDVETFLNGWNFVDMSFDKNNPLSYPRQENRKCRRFYAHIEVTIKLITQLSIFFSIQ